MDTKRHSHRSRQDWLKCMDRFADLVEESRPPQEAAENQINVVPQPPKVKVAIIDDGVKSSVDNLDDIIERGESLVKQTNPKQRHSPYTTSSRGHGTVMAYYIRRVCPNIRLYIAKLDPQPVTSRVTFTIESATEVMHISFSWPLR